MVPPSSSRIIAAEIAAWPSSLETALFGTDDPGAILTAVDTYCTRSLGSGVREVEFYQRGVGAVFGLGLDDGSSVVVKVHRPEIAGGRLDAISLVQRHLADRGLPAPRPLARPAPLAHGIATAEELLRAGTMGNAHHPSVRTGLAEGLFGFVEAATPLLETVPVEETWPVSLPEGRLWPVPHDLRFDFTLPGAGWIDDLGAAALRRLRPPHGRTVIGHRDWRVENLRIEGDRVVGIFDWDSVVAISEPALVGHTAAIFTANWADHSMEPLPTTGESRAFAIDYESFQEHPFTETEWRTADAAHLYAVAYGARCEHSDVTLGLVPDRGPREGWRGLLRARGEDQALAL